MNIVRFEKLKFLLHPNIACFSIYLIFALSKFNWVWFTIEYPVRYTIDHLSSIIELCQVSLGGGIFLLLPMAPCIKPCW